MQVTTRCLDQRSSMNCLLRDNLAPAWISLGKNNQRPPQINNDKSKRVFFLPKHFLLLPFLLLQVAAAVVKEEVHVLGQSALDDAGAVVKEVDKLLRVQNLEFLLLGQLVRRRCQEEKQTKKLTNKHSGKEREPRRLNTFLIHHHHHHHCPYLLPQPSGRGSQPESRPPAEEEQLLPLPLPLQNRKRGKVRNTK